MPGGQADVGLGVAGPPGQHPGPIGGGVLDAVGDQASRGGAWRRWPQPGSRHEQPVPTAGLGSCRSPATGWRPPAVGEGVVQGQHRDAPGGIAEGGVAQLPTGAAHRVRSAAVGRWRCRKPAALLRLQPAASARVRAVQGRPSGRCWA